MGSEHSSFADGRSGSAFVTQAEEVWAKDVWNADVIQRQHAAPGGSGHSFKHALGGARQGLLMGAVAADRHGCLARAEIGYPGIARAVPIGFTAKRADLTVVPDALKLTMLRRCRRLGGNGLQIAKPADCPAHGHLMMARSNFGRQIMHLAGKPTSSLAAG